MSANDQAIPCAQKQDAAPSEAVFQAEAAIDRCREAYNSAFQRSRGEDRSEGWAKMEAGNAYRFAVPPLSGSHNIHDFIACVTDGMLVGAISGAEGARLLYAAQVASHAFRSPATHKSTAA